MVICWISLLVLITCSSTLQLRTINDEKAKCNDHTQAMYYIRRNNSSSKWVIFLESGGGCSTQDACAKRYETSKILMSSEWLKKYPAINGTDFLSTQKKFNPFFMYNHVYVPYCSSDMYTGTIDWTVNNERFYEGQKNFVFAGSHIIDQLFKQLIERHTVEKFTEIVFAGSSAGGIGVMNHIQSLSSQFTSAQGNIRGIIDSSWFVNFEENFYEFWNNDAAKEMTGYQNMSHDGKELCAKEVGGIPCCFQANCMDHYHQFNDTKMFFIVSRNDIYLLKASLVRALSGLLSSDSFSALIMSQIADISSAYSGAMSLSVNSTKDTNDNPHSFFFTSCLQHVYTACSSLWERDQPLGELDVRGFEQYSKLIDSSEIQLPIKYAQFIIPGRMQSIFVRGYGKQTSLMDSLEAWKKGEKQDLRDTCIGVACNPTCPEKLEFIYAVDNWSTEVNIIAMCVLGFITIICCLVKIFLTVQMLRFQRKQGAMLKSGSLLITNTNIPELTVNDMLSVSCLDLTYDVIVEVSKDAAEHDTNGSQDKMIQDTDLEQNKKKKKGRPRMSSMPVKKKTESMFSCCSKAPVHHGVKNILKDINVYFNPGSLVGIMGPSGSGKTTFLDILTGRRWIKPEQRKNIYIDGNELHEMHEHYRSVSAYVLQLERPYYEELTVRENLTLEALMRLSANVSWETIYNRVETVLEETRLIDYADTVVGGDTGGGLSGGQKRKLCVALQLLVYPHIIFLDEPTSGLDSHSANELLTLLHQLTMSKRVVVTTIHQPRSEIFHMFTHILLLVEGKVAYYGSPLKAPDIFIKAINESGSPSRDMLQQTLGQASNKADLIMDMLKDDKAQQIILAYYKKREERNVVNGINRMKSTKSYGTELNTRHVSSNGGFLRTLLALESRNSMRETMFARCYLPVIFTFVPIILGYVYYQADSPLLLISVYCVVTCMGPLFMTSIIINLITSTLRVFLMQYKDGVGYMYQVVVMVFTRMVAITTFPIAICSVIIYLLVNIQYDFWQLVQVTLILLALCQAWIGVFVSVVYSGPSVAMRVCPMVAALSAFTSGFLVPEPNMPIPFFVLFYLNPTFWGMQAICKILLEDRLFGCSEDDSQLSCQASSGNFLLMTFGFLDGSPVTTAFVLVAVIVLTQIYSVFILLYKYSPEPLTKSFWKMCSAFIARSKSKVSPLISNNSRKKDICLINPAKQAPKQTKEAWAKVVKKVLNDQNRLDMENEMDDTETESEFMDGGVGHDVFRRGTVAEKRFMKNNEKVNKELGVTQAMLNNVLSAMTSVSLGETQRPTPAHRSSDPSKLRKQSSLNASTIEDVAYLKKCQQATNTLLLDARKRAWQTSNNQQGGTSVWKKAGLNIMKKNASTIKLRRPEHEDISEKSEDDLIARNHTSIPETSAFTESRDKPSSATSSISKEENSSISKEESDSKDESKDNGLVLEVIGDRQDSGLSSHGESPDSPSSDTDV